MSTSSRKEVSKLVSASLGFVFDGLVGDSDLGAGVLAETGVPGVPGLKARRGSRRMQRTEHLCD